MRERLSVLTVANSLSAGRDLEGVDVVLLIDGHHDRPGLPDCFGDPFARLLCPGREHLFADRVLRLILEEAADFLPT